MIRLVDSGRVVMLTDGHIEGHAWEARFESLLQKVLLGFLITTSGERHNTSFLKSFSSSEPNAIVEKPSGN